MWKKICFPTVLTLALFLISLLTVSISNAQPGDLTIAIKNCPQTVQPGQELKNSFQVLATSTFPTPLQDIAVDIILTSKPVFKKGPVPLAVYSPHYSDGVLLKGGREFISFKGPGTINVKLNGTNTIPADTPEGTYYLVSVIDAAIR
jgi:hypothetical protein